jgi:hypothetical protein
MKLQALFIVAFALGVAGCAEKEQVAPPEAAGAEKAAESAAAEMPAEEAMPAEEIEELGTAAFMTHMHHHASQLEWLNNALEAESLTAAQRPAYWLGGHDAVVGVPEDWRVYIDGMHEAANAVATAPDIAAARAAAQRIEENCVGCHAAAGVGAGSVRMD